MKLVVGQPPFTLRLALTKSDVSVLFRLPTCHFFYFVEPLVRVNVSQPAFRTLSTVNYCYEGIPISFFCKQRLC
jgi:hypothetical protein